MISQMQNLQAFVQNHLFDVVDWRKHVQPDPERKSNAEIAGIVIVTPFNSYKMTIGTFYAEPPPGAPIECKSLGWVSFDDPAAGKHLMGPKRDDLYTEIAKHICRREFTDALAAARREMAEASVDTAAQARAKFADLAARAKKYGIEANVPDETPTAAMSSPAAAPSAEAVGSTAPIPPTPPPLAPVLEGEPWIGAPIVYITNPGEWLSGKGEAPGFIVNIERNGQVCVFVTPSNSEPLYFDRIQRRGSPAAPGRVHTHHCWDFNPTFARLFEDARTLRQRAEAAAQQAEEADRTIADLRQTVADLTARMGAVESPEPANSKERGRKATAAA